MKKVELFIVMLTISIVVCMIPLIQRIYIDFQRNKVAIGVDESFFELSLDRKKIIEELHDCGVSLIFTSSWKRTYDTFQTAYVFDLDKDIEVPLKNVTLVTVVGKGKDEKKIDTIKSYVSANDDVAVGFVEFDPSTTLGRRLVMKRGNGFRIHRIKKAEMEKMGRETEDIMIARYRRAVLERNANVLWIYPIPNASLQENIRFLKEIRNSIRKAGISIERHLALPYMCNSIMNKYQLFFIFFILNFSFILIIEALGIKLNISKEWTLFITLSVLAIISYILDPKHTLEISAVIDAIVFSSIVYIYSVVEKESRGKKEAFILYLLTFLLAFIGGLFIQVLLFDMRYINGALVFRGVKIALVLPIILIAIRYLERGYFTRYFSPTKMDILILVLLGVASIFYVMRSGNYPFIPPSTFERRLRDWLDRFLFVRPRFKECLIGYPLLWIGLRNKIDWLRRYTPLMLLLSAVGPISTMNTFCHIQTPILLSILRTIYGVCFGLVFGIVFEWILSRISSGTTIERK